MDDNQILMAVQEIIQTMEGGFFNGHQVENLIILLDGNPDVMSTCSVAQGGAYLNLLLTRYLILKGTENDR